MARMLLRMADDVAMDWGRERHGIEKNQHPFSYHFYLWRFGTYWVSLKPPGLYPFASKDGGWCHHGLGSWSPWDREKSTYFFRKVFDLWRFGTYWVSLKPPGLYPFTIEDGWLCRHGLGSWSPWNGEESTSSLIEDQMSLKVPGHPNKRPNWWTLTQLHRGRPRNIKLTPNSK